MPYVSCVYAPPPPPEMQSIAKPGGANAIICTDEDGVEWHLTDDSEVGDWLRFNEAGGTVLAYEEPEPEPEPTPTKRKKETRP